MAIKRIDQRLGACFVLGELDAEFLADGGEKFHRGQLRIENQRNIDLCRYLPEQGAHERRLAGADFAGELDETAAFGDAVDEVSEPLAVTFAHEQITGVRRNRERFFVEPKEACIHDPGANST